MPHGRSPPLARLVVGRLGLVDALVKNLGVLVGSILGSLCAAALECDAVTLVLQALRSNQTLDLRSLGVGLLALTLGLDLTANNEFADIIFLAEAKEAADLGSPLGTQTLGVYGVGEAGNVVIALLDNADSEDREIHADNAATNTLPLTLASTTGSVARMALAEEESDTSGVHNTLLHREALLVVSAGDLEDVSLELVADAVGRDLVAHTAVHEDTQLALIIDLNQLLSAIGGV